MSTTPPGNANVAGVANSNLDVWVIPETNLTRNGGTPIVFRGGGEETVESAWAELRSQLGASHDMRPRRGAPLAEYLYRGSPAQKVRESPVDGGRAPSQQQLVRSPITRGSRSKFRQKPPAYRYGYGPIPFSKPCERQGAATPARPTREMRAPQTIGLSISPKPREDPVCPFSATPPSRQELGKVPGWQETGGRKLTHTRTGRVLDWGLLSSHAHVPTRAGAWHTRGA